MKHISKIFLILVAVSLTGYGTASAAPTSRLERTLLPEVDSTYYLGTTTPSIRAWASVITDQLCLAGNCQTNFASSTLLADTNTWSSTGTTTFNGNQHIIGNLQVDGMFYAPVNIVSSGNATINGALTVTGQTTLATSLTGLLKAASGVVSVASAGSDYLAALTGNSLTKGYFLVGNDAGLSQATSSIFISSVGRVGIGTTTPGSNLDVSASAGAEVRITGLLTTALPQLSFYEGSVLGGALTYRGSGDATPKILQIQAKSSGSQLSLGTAGTEKVRIDSTGNVGIGTTTPAQRLQIIGGAGDTQTPATIRLGTSGTRYWDITADKYTGVSNDYNLMFTMAQEYAGGGVPYMVIKASNGNVGIGTTSPTKLLSIAGGAGTYFDGLGNIGIGTANPITVIDSKVNVNTTTGFRFSNPNSGTLAASGVTLDNNNGADFSSNSQTFYGLTGTGYTNIPSWQNVGLIYNGSSVNGQVINSANASGYVAFQVGGIGSTYERARITATGNVGIGTTTPAQRLQIIGGAGDTQTPATIRLGTSGTRYWDITADKYTGVSNDYNLMFTMAQEYAGGGVPYMVIKASNGNVGIGTTSPATKLDVNGTITQLTVKSCTLGLTTDALGSITGCVASDEKLKKNILPLDTSLSTLLKLSPVTYEWRDKDTQVHAGFVAQQVEKIYPQAVVSAGTDTKGVDPNAINALLVKSMQEQQAQITKLQAEVEALKTKQTLNSCINY